MKAVGIAANLPGTNGGFTQCAFHAVDVPVGTTLLIDDRTPDGLCGRLQQKCVDWNAYWRAPDAHGVKLNIEQALELLRDALGVEVYIDLTMFEPAVEALYSVEIGKYEDGQFGDDELARIEGERFEMMQLIRRTSP